MVQIFCGYSGLFNFILCLFFSIFILFNNKGNLINRVFSLWSLSVALWSLGYFIWLFTQEASQALFWTRFLMAGAILIPASFLHFSYTYLELQNDPKRKKILLATYLFAFAYLFLDFTPYFIAGVEPRYWFRWWPVPGPAYHFYQIYFVAIVIYTHVLFFREAFLAQGIKRKQLMIVAVGTAIAFAGGSTNFFLWYNIPIPPVLNFLVVGYVGLIFYAVLHYKLWDIDLILKKTLVFAGLFAMVMTSVVAITMMTQMFIGQYFKIHPTLTTALGVAIAMILYDPSKKLLIHATDNFLFQKQFRLSSIIAQASQAIAFVQSLKWLARRIVAFLVVKCRIKHAVIYIRNEEMGYFSRGAIRGYALGYYPADELAEDHLMVRYLYESRQPIEIRRLEALIEQNKKSQIMQTGLQMILKFMKECRAEVMIPSFLRRRIDEAGIGKEVAPRDKEDEITLRNILILGGKKSDEPYTDEELEMFYSLAQESAIAIENARLYDEAIQRTELLAIMNQELADTNEKLQVTQASLIVAEKNATMVGMAQAIGHEVNNPLTTVLMRVDSIYKDKIRRCRDLADKISKQSPPTPEDVQKFMKVLTSIEDDIARASRSAHRINAVVHTLTDILRDTKGEMGALSLRVIFHEAIEATRFSTYEENPTGCEVKLDVASNIMIRGNLEQLLQVFVNLLKNSFEAMDKTKDRRIVISADLDSQDPKMARILFVDNGPGIPPEVLPKIWGQGFTTKIRKDNSIGAAGQGQGLFVCKHMIESVHRGSIVCESVLDKGTTFIIKLPIADMEVRHA